jgi:tetratricopeptide (TPR) repeat protein
MTSSAMTACPDCGVPNAADHNYCKHCGVALKVASSDRELAATPAERNLERYRALVDAYPDNATAHFNLGSSYYHLGQVGNAIRAFQRAVQLDDAMPAAHYHLGINYERHGLESLAMSALTRALQLDPSDEAAASALQELQR